LVDACLTARGQAFRVNGLAGFAGGGGSCIQQSGAPRQSSDPDKNIFLAGAPDHSWKWEMRKSRGTVSSAAGPAGCCAALAAMRHACWGITWICILDDWIVIVAARILCRTACGFSARAAQRLGFKGIMKQIFSTDDVLPRDRFECWHDVICRHVIPHESVPECRTTFAARVETAVLADLALVSFDIGSMKCTYEKHHIGAMADELLLVRQVKGSMSLEQNDRSVSLAAGEMTLVDSRLIYSCRLSADASVLVAKYPRRSLMQRVGKIDRFIARKLTADSGESGLLSDYLRILPAHTESLSASAPQVSNQLLDLIAVALWKADGGEDVPHVGSSRAILARQLRAAIERNLSDHTVTAESLAKLAGISLRYANAILSEDNTSVGRLLQARRLEHCRRALADPLKMHRSISDIAYCFGFTDMTHFGRRFRQAFGLLPSDFRKVQRAAPQAIDNFQGSCPSSS
jgi:AraC family transcriptional regulator, positive regulator of tynA and feaB